jgi:hypothetical protein
LLLVLSENDHLTKRKWLPLKYFIKGKPRGRGSLLSIFKRDLILYLEGIYLTFPVP